MNSDRTARLGIYPPIMLANSAGETSPPDLAQGGRLQTRATKAE